MSNGKVTVGAGTPKERELEITDFMQSGFKDNRLITIAELEDGSYMFGVENPPSTGRGAQSMLLLTKESLIALVSTAVLYYNSKGWNTQEILRAAMDKDLIDISCSENLPFPLTKKKKKK